MKYAIINIDNALKAGIRKEYHIMNQSKSMLIVNENELAKVWRPVAAGNQARRKIDRQKRIK